MFITVKQSVFDVNKWKSRFIFKQDTSYCTRELCASDNSDTERGKDQYAQQNAKLPSGSQLWGPVLGRSCSLPYTFVLNGEVSSYLEDLLSTD